MFAVPATRAVARTAAASRVVASRVANRALVSAFMHADAIVRAPAPAARAAYSALARSSLARTATAGAVPASGPASGLRGAWRMLPGAVSRASGPNVRAVAIRCLCASAKVGGVCVCVCVCVVRCRRAACWCWGLQWWVPPNPHARLLASCGHAAQCIHALRVAATPGVGAAPPLACG